jgi:hypothetical protein
MFEENKIGSLTALKTGLNYPYCYDFLCLLVLQLTRHSSRSGWSANERGMRGYYLQHVKAIKKSLHNDTIVAMLRWRLQIHIYMYTYIYVYIWQEIITNICSSLQCVRLSVKSWQTLLLTGLEVNSILIPYCNFRNVE